VKRKEEKKHGHHSLLEGKGEKREDDPRMARCRKREEYGSGGEKRGGKVGSPNFFKKKGG